MSSPCHRVAYRIWSVVLLGVSFWTASVHAVQLDTFSPPQVPGLLSKAEAKGKADAALLQAFREYQAHMAGGKAAPFRPSNPLLQFANGRILVDAVATRDADALLAALQGLGLERGSRYGAVVSGWLPIGMVKKAVALDSLKSVSASWRPLTNAGLVTSEGDRAMRADLARSNWGVQGTGITVGVLSDSYNQQHGAADDQANDDLPPAVNVLDDTGNCSGPCTDEGRAMMQIIHDVAPGAGLAFHTAFGGQAGFANGIRALADAGADVIVDDVIYFAEPMFQDGVIAQAVDDVVASGVAYFSAAGNQARNSYEAAFDPSGEPLYVSGGYRGELHDFNPGGGVDWLQSITVPVGGIVIVTLQWDSPFGSLHQGDGSSNDVDIYLADAGGTLIFAQSISDNIASGEPVETLQFVNYGFGTEFNIAITHYDGPQAGLMKYVILGSSGVAVNEYRTDSGTLYGHANAAGAEAVGAAFYQKTPEFGVNPPQLEAFSSAGGVPILFDSAGNRLSTPLLRDKPELVAPDGVNTTFFYQDSSLDTDDWPNFFGTSAAAPHAAAVAALMQEVNAGLTPADLYQALEQTAINMDAPGFDHDSGWGLVEANLAVEVAAGSAPPPPANEPPVAVNDSYQTPKNTQLIVGSPGVLGNDYDPDGGPSSLSAGLVSGPAHGSLTLAAGGGFTYSPDTNYTGKDQFSYRVYDGNDYSPEAVVSINVKKGKGGGDGTGGGGGGSFCDQRPTHPKCQ